MRAKVLDRCIGWGVWTWIILVLVLCFLGISRAKGQEAAAPKTDHVKSANCSVKTDTTFKSYALHYHVDYTDRQPYDVLVEVSQDDGVLWDQCLAFKRAMYMAAIEEDIANARAEMKRKRDERYVIDVKRLAKK